MDRSTFFANFRQPESKEEAISLLKQIKALGLDWHLDDDPKTVVFHGDQRSFTDHEAQFLDDLVDNLNLLWSGTEHSSLINAGAWDAVEEAGWLDDTPMKQEGWGKDPENTAESVTAFVDKMLHEKEAPSATIDRLFEDQEEDDSVAYVSPAPNLARLVVKARFNPKWNAPKMDYEVTGNVARLVTSQPISEIADEVAQLLSGRGVRITADEVRKALEADADLQTANPR